MSEPDDYEDSYSDTDMPQCPRCDGLCEVLCYCGGDLCVCDNDGYETCPMCGGEGSITHAEYDRYLERQRRADEAWRKASEQ